MIIRACVVMVWVLSVMAVAAHGQTLPLGEPVGGFPNWGERVLHEWMNRARSSPSADLAGCPAGNCAEAQCYAPIEPLQWSLPLNRGARFHSQHQVTNGYFGHDTLCTLVSDIGTKYPGSCDAAASCSCVGGIRSCSAAGCTMWSSRLSLFGASAWGEIIAGPRDPDHAFYMWLWEPSSTSGCQFTQTNGHRWNILTTTGAVGAGIEGPSVGDFGRPTSTSGKVPSAAHYPQQAPEVELWANWFDTAGPSESFAVVDGLPYAMTLQRGTALNGAFRAIVGNVGTGCHRYYFLFRDQGGAITRYPANGTFAIGTGSGCPDWIGTRRADLDASKQSDVILRNSVTGDIGAWLMNGTRIASGAMIGRAPGVTIAGEGDFNGDERADIVFRDASGNAGLWLMNGTSILAGGLIANTGAYEIVGVNDFNGDGKADLLLQDPVGDIGVWLMDSFSIAAGARVGTPASYSVAGTGDLNGDGKADIVLRDPTGGIGVWLMNGASIAAGSFIGNAGASAVEAVADFDGDGRADILLRDGSGNIGMWIMNAAAITRGALVGRAATSTVAGWGDYNSDGRADILLRDASGNAGVWLMDGTSVITGAFIGNAGVSYEIR